MLCSSVLLGQNTINDGFQALNNGDYETVVRIFTPLAEQGDALAQHNLGVVYANGRGVIQNDQTAVEWYRLAAEQGVAQAQSNLGFMYANGRGVIQNDVLAHMWWNIAASTGYENARTNRDIVASKLTSADLSRAQQLAAECVNKNYKDC